MKSRAADPIDSALDRLAAAREGARRFHADAFGDADPERCFGDFLLRVRNRDRSTLEKRYGAEQTKSALAETSGTTGGYLVPNDFRDGLMADVADAAFFRPRATVVPVRSSSVKLPVLDATTAPAAAGTAPFFGGLLLNFAAAEGQALSETEPAFRQVELHPWDLSGYAVASRTLEQDGGPTLLAWLARTFARSIAWYEDYYFLQGGGVGEPLGVVNAGCRLTVSRGTAGHLKVADAQAMLAKLYALGEPVWLMNRTALTDLAAFTGWIPNGPLCLYGSGVTPLTQSPALGSTGDVVLVDPSLYLIGDRGEVAVAYSDQVPAQFTKYQSVWRVLERVDGQPLLNAPITLPDGSSSQVSPFVVLV